MKNFIVLYHGGITCDRGIETLISLLSLNTNILGVIIGNGDVSYINKLKQLAVDKKVEKRLIIHEAVPIADLWKYIGAVDLSLMMISGSTKSYYYSLPNKFFESIQALTPIVASNFPEMKRLIDEYRIGLTCDPDNIIAINECIEKMRTDGLYYSTCKNNLKKAKEELCWDNEKKNLETAMNQYIFSSV